VEFSGCENSNLTACSTCSNVGLQGRGKIQIFLAMVEKNFHKWTIEQPWRVSRDAMMLKSRSSLQFYHCEHMTSWSVHIYKTNKCTDRSSSRASFKITWRSYRTLKEHFLLWKHPEGAPWRSISYFGNCLCSPFWKGERKRVSVGQSVPYLTRSNIKGL